jgi:hypothetical protein
MKLDLVKEKVTLINQIKVGKKEMELYENIQTHVIQSVNAF